MIRAILITVAALTGCCPNAQPYRVSAAPAVPYGQQEQHEPGYAPAYPPYYEWDHAARVLYRATPQ